MLRDRLNLALERLKADRWKDFEDLCSAFAAAQYPNLITLAAVSGDRGRDGTLWQPEDDPSVVLQYSVAANWERKLKDTIVRLRKEFPAVQVVIFCSSQTIGPAADTVTGDTLKAHGIFIQVRDRSWFLDRVHADPASTHAAERLSKQVVDPLLASEDIVDAHAQVLTDHEAAAGLVYIALQLEDDALDKGLTKTCYEGLVRAVLRNTDPKHPMPIAEVQRRVREIVPSGDDEVVATQATSALKRLERRYVRHHKPEDAWCLSYEERSRLAGRVVALELLDSGLHHALVDQIRASAEARDLSLPDKVDELAGRARLLIDKILLERGEAFVAALQNNAVAIYTVEELVARVVDDLAEKADRSGLKGDAVPLLADAIHAVLLYPSPELLSHLQLLARSYTLFSMLRATPDIQRAIVKMFSGGEIWLDTTAALPLFAETLVDEDERFFTSLLSAAQDAGVKIYVTQGVVEEIERHMNRCVAYSRMGDWEGSVPFLASAYTLAGSPNTSGLSKWLEEFRGTARPEDDIVEYLKDELSITLRPLTNELNNAPEELRVAVQEEWNSIQDKRRARSSSRLDAMTAMKLAAHDAENYVGVIEHRRKTAESPFGYTAWWLTLDRAAYRIHRLLCERMAENPPAPPVLSPDFLSQYLSIGPIRQHLKRGTEARLPVMLEVGALDFVSPDLLAAAQRVRDDFDGLPPRVVRRRIRDFLDSERRKQGTIAKKGLGVIEDSL